MKVRVCGLYVFLYVEPWLYIIYIHVYMYILIVKWTLCVDTEFVICFVVTQVLVHVQCTYIVHGNTVHVYNIYTM